MFLHGGYCVDVCPLSRHCVDIALHSTDCMDMFAGSLLHLGLVYVLVDFRG